MLVASVNRNRKTNTADLDSCVSQVLLVDGNGILHPRGEPALSATNAPMQQSVYTASAYTAKCRYSEVPIQRSLRTLLATHVPLSRNPYASIPPPSASHAPDTKQHDGSNTSLLILQRNCLPHRGKDRVPIIVLLSSGKQKNDSNSNVAQLLTPPPSLPHSSSPTRIQMPNHAHIESSALRLWSSVALGGGG